MEKTSITLEFEFNGMQYLGWATPSDARATDEFAKSYHVVLNQVFFGNMSHDHGKWLIDEQRPHDLVKAAGECLNSKIKQSEQDDTSTEATLERGQQAMAVEEKLKSEDKNKQTAQKEQAEDAENWRNEG